MTKVTMTGIAWGGVTFEMDMRGGDTQLIVAIERQLPDGYWQMEEEMPANLDERQARRVRSVHTELATLGPRPPGEWSNPDWKPGESG